MHYGCIAQKLGHSFSPEIHAQLGTYRYELCELTPDAVGNFLEKRDFLGINVTIPYKETVIPYLSHIDEQAERIGAVNTVVNRGGRLYGYNTDFYGMQSLIERLGLSLEGKKVAVLGTGGTSRTAVAVAEAMGASEVLRVSRTAKDGAMDYETLTRVHRDVAVIINTTPCGMFPNPDAAAVDVGDFPTLLGVVDAVYNPLRPKLVLDAKKRGIAAEGGLYMLVAQAVRASELFLDTTYPQGTVERIYQKLMRQKENVVLIGMPSSGKSTVGRLLAAHMGREFVDTDDLIVQTAGRSIPEIFSEAGETAFREIESQVIREQVSQKNATVIATGGGAILREENLDALRRNGRLYFLDRPLSDLIPTDDRPLSSTREAVETRYRERYPRYCAAADVRIPVTGDAEWVADKIEKELLAE